MPRKCLFCPNPVDSAEHLWSDWILEDLKPVEPIHIKFGKTFAKWVDDPEVRIKCVCQKCNNGWMSAIGGINGITKGFQGCVVTIIVGHLVIQVLTMHVLPMFATNRIRPVDKPGAWDVDLLEIWPVFGEKRWPPRLSFVAKGRTPHHIAHLINRWKIGEDITK